MTNVDKRTNKPTPSDAKRENKPASFDHVDRARLNRRAKIFGFEYFDLTGQTTEGAVPDLFEQNMLAKENENKEFHHAALVSAYRNTVKSYDFNDLYELFDLHYHEVLLLWTKGKIVGFYTGPIDGSSDVIDVRFPAFQFTKDGHPKPIVADIIHILNRAEMPLNAMALWFVSTNGWLDGKRPQDLIDDRATPDPERDGDPDAQTLDVLQAARYEADPVVG